MRDEPITAWVTKYALTTGIQVVSGNVTDGMLSYSTGKYLEHAHGKDWHRTPESALARAEEMRLAKIKSLQKSIAKLEALTFTV